MTGQQIDFASLPALSSDAHRVGGGFVVRFEWRAGQFGAEWSPRPPTKRELRRVLDRYRSHRDAFIEELARKLGTSVAVLEVPL